MRTAVVMALLYGGAAQAMDALPALGASAALLSVSGISSGAYMAVQDRKSVV